MHLSTSRLRRRAPDGGDAPRFDAADDATQPAIPAFLLPLSLSRLPMGRLPASDGLRVLDRLRPNRWDLVALPLVLGVIGLVAFGLANMNAGETPVAAPAGPAVFLDPRHLPDYALRTTIRMFAALGVSLLFTFTYAAAAAKSRRLGPLLVPVLDILQSVPILGFLSFTTAFFMGLFPGSGASSANWGAECAAVFAIFTSQAWNMAFSFYQALKTLPADLVEASRSLRLNGWQRFWILEVPHAMPGLVWNMMMSMSGGWFFVVAAEAVTVGDKRIELPGIGAYVAAAIKAEDGAAILWALCAMLVVILVYDQLFFRPLVAWAQKFHPEQEPGMPMMRSWLLRLFQQTRFFTAIAAPLQETAARLARLRLPTRFHGPHARAQRAATTRLMQPENTINAKNEPRGKDPVDRRARWGDRLWFGGVLLLALYVSVRAGIFIMGSLDARELLGVIWFGVLTLARVMGLLALLSLLWVPAGVFIGLRPRLAQRLQPVVQFLAAFPANLLFPPAVVAIQTFHLDPDWWLSPLMILGAQWYLLFNVIAGASAYPGDLLYAARNLHLKGGKWWLKAVLPGILPYYVTGAVTAAGGAWNASIVAEWVSWGGKTLEARGLGAYIAKASTAGDYPRLALGIIVMSLFVLAMNRLVWQRLGKLTERGAAGGGQG